MQSGSFRRVGWNDARELAGFAALPADLTVRGDHADDIRRGIDRTVDEALAQPSSEAFDRFVEAHILDFRQRVVALLKTINTPGELPETTNTVWLAELLGEGADLELEFCEFTLWGSVRRLAAVDHARFEQDDLHAELGRRLAAAFVVGLLCWLVVQRSATAPTVRPEAVEAALVVLRQSALDTVAALADLTPAESEPGPLDPIPCDAEDYALAMSDG